MEGILQTHLGQKGEPLQVNQTLSKNAASRQRYEHTMKLIFLINSSSSLKLFVFSSCSWLHRGAFLQPSSNSLFWEHMLSVMIGEPKVPKALDQCNTQQQCQAWAQQSFLVRPGLGTKSDNDDRNCQLACWTQALLCIDLSCSCSETVPGSDSDHNHDSCDSGPSLRLAACWCPMLSLTRIRGKRIMFCTWLQTQLWLGLHVPLAICFRFKNFTPHLVGP